MSLRNSYTIYCDGASRKDGRGGWGYIVYRGQTALYHACGGEYNTTNNRMELMAAVRALQSLPAGAEASVYSDSKYVVDGITEHMDAWLRAGWRASGNKEVKHKDLWTLLGNLDCDFKVEWLWVRGHTGVPGNEKADILAGLGVPEEVQPQTLRGAHGEAPISPVRVNRSPVKRGVHNPRRGTVANTKSPR